MPLHEFYVIDKLIIVPEYILKISFPIYAIFFSSVWNACLHSVSGKESPTNWIDPGDHLFI